MGFGLLGFWASGLLDFWTFGLLGFWASGLLDFWAFGILDFWTFGLFDFWASGILGFLAFPAFKKSYGGLQMQARSQKKCLGLVQYERNFARNVLF